jgi:hypothetical protein
MTAVMEMANVLVGVAGDRGMPGLIELLGLVRGPTGAGGGGGGAADGEQQRVFDVHRPRLLRRLVENRLPSWALLHLEQDKKVVAAARAAPRLGAIRDSLRLAECGQAVAPARSHAHTTVAIAKARRAVAVAERDLERRLARLQ